MGELAGGQTDLPKFEKEDGLMEKLLTARELAEILGVRPGTIFSWLSRGVDVPHVKISGTVRFREKGIQDWFLKNELERKKRNFGL
jgi:predicted DNA-binding transcriptional regulator AlpA